MTKDEVSFHRNLNALARLCGFELTEEVIELYDHALARHGYAALSAAVVEIATSRKATDRFPSIRDIEDVISPRLSDEALADQAANAIIRAVSKHGYTWSQVVPEGTFQDVMERELGSLAAQTVREMGGWYHVASEVGRLTELTAMRAQLKKAALSTLQLARAGFTRGQSGPPMLDDRGNLRRKPAELERVDPMSCLPPKKDS